MLVDEQSEGLYSVSFTLDEMREVHHLSVDRPYGKEGIIKHALTIGLDLLSDRDVLLEE